MDHLSGSFDGNDLGTEVDYVQPSFHLPANASSNPNDISLQRTLVKLSMKTV